MKSTCVRLLCEGTVQSFEISGAVNGHFKLAVVGSGEKSKRHHLQIYAAKTTPFYFLKGRNGNNSDENLCFLLKLKMTLLDGRVSQRDL